MRNEIWEARSQSNTKVYHGGDPNAPWLQHLGEEVVLDGPGDGQLEVGRQRALEDGLVLRRRVGAGEGSG